MKKFIIQPGKIGDIIICLPIAMEFLNRGYHVTWPILEIYHDSFQKHFPEINFIPIKCIIQKSYSFVNNLFLDKFKDHDIVDLCFGFSDYPNNSKYRHQKKYHFDEYKYQLANMDFCKWNLKIQRDFKKEDVLYKKLVTSKQYVLCHFNASDRKIQPNISKFIDTKEFDIIHISPITTDIFDWLTIIEKASIICMIDSCYSNLVEQLNFTNKKYFFYKPNYYHDILENGEFKGVPVLRNEWIIMKN